MWIGTSGSLNDALAFNNPDAEVVTVIQDSGGARTATLVAGSTSASFNLPGNGWATVDPQKTPREPPSFPQQATPWKPPRPRGEMPPARPHGQRARGAESGSRVGKHGSGRLPSGGGRFEHRCQGRRTGSRIRLG
ncbi:MAG: hypothetical protein JW751_18130 [Polyangiaceae bacterium]|nr:hypothetical protein [Polyangiaceae bacterium]